jgi:hypothetical protein
MHVRRWLVLGAALLAAGGAARAQDPQPDPKAVELLREAHEQRYGWDAAFPGFEAVLTVSHGGREHRGSARVGPDLKVDVSGIADERAATWAREALSSIAAHRRSVPFAGSDGRYPLTFGPQDHHPAGRLVRLNDALNSTYRIRDGQIMQINRSAGPRLRFTIDIVENIRTAERKVLPRVFTVSYFVADTGELQKSETYRDGYREVGKYLLPEFRSQVTAEDGGTASAALRLEEHRLL